MRPKKKKCTYKKINLGNYMVMVDMDVVYVMVDVLDGEGQEELCRIQDPVWRGLVELGWGVASISSRTQSGSKARR